MCLLYLHKDILEKDRIPFYRDKAHNFNEQIANAWLLVQI